MTGDQFQDKIILISGGTGSFGHAIARRFLQGTVREVRIFSRDEKKQEDMRLSFNDARLKFYLGDVRRVPQRAGGDARRQFRVSRSGAQAGSIVRVLSDGSNAD